MAENNKALTEEEIVTWSRESYQKAMSFLAERGVISETVAVQESRYLAPVIAIWKIKSTESKWYWVISGDVPTDMLGLDASNNAREAVRSFSLKWQMEAENILRQNPTEETQVQFAKLLQSRAEGLYEMFEHEQYWQNA